MSATMVQGEGSRVLGFRVLGFRIEDLGFWVLSFEFRISSFRF
jgi:hypothetical protein